MRLEEMPLRMSSEDRNFDMDEETDYLLQPTDDAMRPIIKRNRRINACSRFFKHFFCGYVKTQKYIGTYYILGLFYIHYSKMAGFIMYIMHFFFILSFDFEMY